MCIIFCQLPAGLATVMIASHADLQASNGTAWASRTRNTSSACSHRFISSVLLSKKYRNDREALSSCKRRYIQAPEETGLYFFHAEAENGEFFSFRWIVAPPPLSSDSPGKQREAKVALLLANMNWNAYNNFGGRSNVRICF